MGHVMITVGIRNTFGTAFGVMSGRGRLETVGLDGGDVRPFLKK
jgi:hypothetical protein